MFSKTAFNEHQISFPGHQNHANRSLILIDICNSDVLHPGRPNVSKDELRSKLSELYKASKDQVSCFGFRTQYGGGKSTGFALIYDSAEAMKKFEPRYRLVRYGQATKIEKASRQQRMYTLLGALMALLRHGYMMGECEVVHLVREMLMFCADRQAKEEPRQDVARYGEGEERWREEEEISDQHSRDGLGGLLLLRDAFAACSSTCLRVCDSCIRQAFLWWV